MEVMLFNNKPTHFKNKLLAIYGDIIDLNREGFTFNQIDYNDNIKVKDFLCFDIESINNIFNELEINTSLLDKRIKDLSSAFKKLIILAYHLLVGYNNILLNYFDKGLSKKYKNNIINYLKRNYNGELVIVSNDLVFLNRLCKNVVVFKNKNIVFNGSFKKLYKSKLKLDYPEIINFINIANNKGNNLAYTIDNKELLKDIYRSLK